MVAGVAATFKTDASESRVEAARRLVQERFDRMSAMAPGQGREKLLTLLALGLADDFLERQGVVEDRLDRLSARIESALGRKTP